MLPEGYEILPLRLVDAAALAAAFDRNREHLAPWNPVRPEVYYTPAGQQALIRDRLEWAEQGLFDSWLLWAGGQVVGAATIQNMVRGAMQGGTISYWVDGGHLRRGLAAGLVEFLVGRGGELGLHRLEAATMVENLASQAVLRRCGFEQYGVVPAFLYLAGAWRDHVLFNRVLHDGPPRGH